MFVKKFEDYKEGDKYYVCRRARAGRKNKMGRLKREEKYYEWFLIKNMSRGYSGSLIINQIVFPKEFVGKRIRLLVEVIE